MGEAVHSQQKAHVTSVSGAKAAETRDRRVAAVVTKLAAERYLGIALGQ